MVSTESYFQAGYDNHWELLKKFSKKLKTNIQTVHLGPPQHLIPSSL